jgi:RNA polymerase sigma-B factor
MSHGSDEGLPTMDSEDLLATAAPPLAGDSFGSDHAAGGGSAPMPSARGRSAAAAGGRRGARPDHAGGGARQRRNALVEEHRGLAERYVRRYANRGVARDDLRQTALLALVQAADRFDPELGVEFGAFAGRTIDGTLKRYFRDRTWAVRPPRSLQELHLRLRRADDELSQRLCRRPTVAELAQEVDEDIDRVHEALEASSAHGALSIDVPRAGDESYEPDHSWLGTVDDGFGRTEARIIVDDLLVGIDDRLREILRLRYVECLTQQEIGDRLGISQSYLSRIIRHGLASMRAALRDTTAP